MGRRTGVSFVLAVVAVAAAAVSGCTAPRPPLVVTDPDPSVKIPAIKVAVARGDRSVIPQLVKELESDDAAVRFYAIDALEKFTGERFGFEYYQDDDRRKPALQKWQEWLKAQQQQVDKPGGK
jgi:hypothetical protein